MIDKFDNTRYLVEGYRNKVLVSVNSGIDSIRKAYDKAKELKVNCDRVLIYELTTKLIDDTPG